MEKKDDLIIIIKDEPNEPLIKELKNGIRILLIDDVVTTGATINSCLNAIQKNKKFNITVAALAGNKFT